MQDGAATGGAAVGGAHGWALDALSDDPVVGAQMVGERRPGDIIRVALGSMALLLAGVIAAGPDVGVFEVDIFHLINHLPAALTPALEVVMQAGALVAVPVAGVCALATRRVRLGRDLVLAGTAGWLLAKVVKDIVGRGRPATLFSDVIVHGSAQTGFGFPSGHVAVVAAMATAAGPWLPPRARRLSWAVVAMVGLARIFVGAHLPVDVIGGAAVGWVSGAALHLLLGSPTARATAETVRDALARSGIGVAEVGVAAVDARGSTPFFLRLDDGRRVFAKVVGRDERNADLLFKGWRNIAFREIEDEQPFASPKRQIEHEAYLALLAERAGVRTPAVLLTADVGQGRILLAQALVAGRTLDRVDPADLDGPVLAAVWQQVRLLHAARIAHRDLRLANLLLDDSRQPWLIDFGFAESAASEHRLRQDIAELLCSLATLVGAVSAVASAVDALGVEAIGASLPLVQPLALSTATRRDLKRRPELLAGLRRAVVEATGMPDSEPERLIRIRPRSVLILLAAGLAVHLLLPQVGDFRETAQALRTAEPGWLGLVLVLSAVSYVMAAIALMGAVPQRLALGRTVAVQVASSFVGRLTPAGVGGLGLTARYLDRAGVQRPAVVAALAVNTLASFLLHMLGLVLAGFAVGAAGLGDVHVPKGWPVLVAVTAALALIGLVLFLPAVRDRARSYGVIGLRSLRTVLRQPTKALALFGGSAGLTASYALALVASLAAFGAHPPLVKVVAVYLGGAAVASVSPTPGGLGAIEAALIAGLTAIAGVASAPAIAAVLTFRLATFWVPVLPGWFCFRLLRARKLV